MTRSLDALMAQLPPALLAEQLVHRLGIEVVEWSPDRVVATMPVAGNRQPFGLLHGGASAALAETVGSLAAAAQVAPNGMFVGLELSCTHHRPAREGVVTGIAVPLHQGRLIGTYEVVINDDHDRRISTARLTCLLRRRSAGEASDAG